MVGKKQQLSPEDARLFARRAELKELLKEVGCELEGFDPGVSLCFDSKDGWQGESHLHHIQFDFSEWQWLEPLLKELKALRLLKAQARLVVGSDNDNICRAGYINAMRDMLK